MNEERIITAATVIEKSVKAGIKVKAVIGDAAYSEKGNIEYTKENEIQLVANLNPSVTQGFRKKEDEFEFNKDAGSTFVRLGKWL
jgi:hypothetical protein